MLDYGDDPATVVDQLDISLAEVHEALAYCYDNLDEMETHRERREELVGELRTESQAPDSVEQ